MSKDTKQICVADLCFEAPPPPSDWPFDSTPSLGTSRLTWPATAVEVCLHIPASVSTIQ